MQSNRTSEPGSGSSAGDLAFPAPARADDPDYYLHNAFIVLDFVLERDGHLFSPEERAHFDALKAAPEGSRRLFARLFNRKGPFFRLASLSYEEIPDLKGAVAALVEAGLMRHHAPEDGLEPLVALFTVPELKGALKAHGIPLPRPSRREHIVLSLVDALGESLRDPLLSGGAVITLCHRSLFDRVFRLFFLNEWLGPGTLIALDLDHITFPSYTVMRSRPVFETRAQLLDYEAALADLSALSDLDTPELRDELLTRLAELRGLILAAPPPRPGEHPFLARFTGAAVRAQALYRGARILERQRAFAEAAACHGFLLASPWLPQRRGRIWERLSVDRIHLKDPTGAYDACCAALADPEVGEGERGDLLTRRDRLARSLGLPLPPRAPGSSPPTLTLRAPLVSQGLHQRTLFQDPGGDAVIVERLALQHFAARGWSGTWAENGLYTTLFGRIFWDILFAEVPDVFQTPFQDAPLDLRTQAFFPAREGAIRARLAAVAEGEIGPWLKASAVHGGAACRGVAWGVWEDDVLEAAALALGGAALALIFEALARDYRRLSRGLPDLLLWKGPGEAKMVEVKSPRDRLSKEQTAWLRRLAQGGVSVAVLKVEAAAGPAKEAGEDGDAQGDGAGA